MPDTDDTLHSIEAYSFRQNYLLSQMIHLHVAGSFFLIGLASGSLSTFMMVCVPGLTTAMLGYVRYQLHRMEDHVRAHQIGAQICLVAGAATVPLANVLGSTMREVLRQQVSFMLFYWLNFMTFAVWVQINAIPVRRRLGLFVWIAVVCIATPSWSALSEAEELCALAIIFSASELIGHALRQQHRMTQAFRLEAVSQRMGDSRLNHVIKNKTCVATFLVDRVLWQLSTTKGGAGADEVAAAEVARCVTQLQSVEAILQQNAEWCHLREIFVQLQSGRYVSTRVLTDLPALLSRVAQRPSYRQSSSALKQSLVQLRSEAEDSSCGASATSGDSMASSAGSSTEPGPPRVVFESCPHRLCVDDKILLLCLEECFSNVAKYSDAALAPQVLFALVPPPPVPGGAPAREGEGGTTAPAPGAAPAAREFLRVQIDSVNRRSVQRLTAQECVSMMDVGTQQHRASSGGVEDDGPTGHLSNGLGLSSVVKAAHAVGGAARLSAYTDEDARHHTVLDLTLPVDTRASSDDLGSTSSSSGGADAAAPPDHGGAEDRVPLLHRHRPGDVRDVAGLARPDIQQEGCRHRERHLGRLGQPGRRRDQPDEAADLLEHTTDRGPRAEGDGPWVLALDDDSFMRLTLEFTLNSLRAGRRSAVLGNDGLADVERLYSLACETPCASQPDLIILDESMMFPPACRLLGSAVAAELRARGYRGKLCIYTGRSLEEMAYLRLDKSIDLVLSKGTVTFANMPPLLLKLLRGESCQERVKVI